MHDCVCLVRPHYRWGVIVCPRVRRCSPAQQEASGDISPTETANSPGCLLRPTSSPGLRTGGDPFPERDPRLPAPPATSAPRPQTFHVHPQLLEG